METQRAQSTGWIKASSLPLYIHNVPYKQSTYGFQFSHLKIGVILLRNGKGQKIWPKMPDLAQRTQVPGSVPSSAV